MQVHTRNERTVEEKEESGREGKRMREREGESGRKGKGLGVFEDTLILGRASVSVPSLPLLPASLASVWCIITPFFIHWGHGHSYALFRSFFEITHSFGRQPVLLWYTRLQKLQLSKHPEK